MPNLNVEINHSLSQDVALQRIKGLLNKLKVEYGTTVSDLKESWNGNVCEFSFKAMGMSVEGTLMGSSDSVKLDAKIPFAALPFKGMIEKTITEEAKKLLV